MHSLVKLRPAHFLRNSLNQRSSSFYQGSWLVWLVCLISFASIGPKYALARPHRDFPIAAEEQTYVFGPDGTYSFSYDTGKGEHQSFRLETRDASGRVSGRYGYIDPEGALRITQYQADSTGYRANMIIYRKVASPPPEPLLVGPIPRRFSKAGQRASARNSPGRGSSAPVGPVPFFPPNEPVLIIGPLPKPLQPPIGQRADDQSEGFNLNMLQDIALLNLAQGDQQDSQSIEILDVPQGPPPNAIPSGVLQTFLQDSFHKIFRGSVTGNVPDSVFNSSQQKISLDGSQEGRFDGLQSTFSQDDLIKISQELLQGPEVKLNMATKVQKPNFLIPNSFRVNRTLSNSTNNEERVPKTPYIKSPKVNATNTFSKLPAFNKTYDVFIKVVNNSDRLNFTQQRQNNSLVAEMGNNTLPTPPINIRKKNYTNPFQPNISDSQKMFPVSKVNKKEVTKADTQRAPSLSVPINIPPLPPLTYLPADRTKPPSYSTFVGQLPDRLPAVT